MIDIRAARPADAPAVGALLHQLGYELTVAEVSARLKELRQRTAGPVLLATEDGEILGLIALHWVTMLHIIKPEARITALIVRDGSRGKGVGRALVSAGADLAAAAGCGRLEVTTALGRTDAQAFYRALGFTASSLRLHRKLA